MRGTFPTSSLPHQAWPLGGSHPSRQGPVAQRLSSSALAQGPAEPSTRLLLRTSCVVRFGGGRDASSLQPPSVHHGSSPRHKRAFLDAYVVDVFFGHSLQQGAVARPQAGLFMQESKRHSPENSGGGRVSRRVEEPMSPWLCCEAFRRGRNLEDFKGRKTDIKWKQRDTTGRTGGPGPRSWTELEVTASEAGIF